jgi:phosphoglycolate phosphatase-like HAD superfamily hydrolase
MNPKIIYALDFDGVICDSAVETALTGWKAARVLWDDMALNKLPSQALIDDFRDIRPLMETGYEAILIVRLLFQGENTQTILKHYPQKIQATIQSSNKNISDLKQLFGDIRDRWIKDDIKDWVQMNPLFDGIVEKLQRLNAQKIHWYIITTKQERFVNQIFNAHQIKLSPDKIFGLDRNLGKETILSTLIEQHPQQDFYFVEDRLPMLQKVLKNTQLQDVQLFFATWGYNTPEDKQQAHQNTRIKLIKLHDFLT